MADTRIVLSDTYFINVDDMQWILMYKKNGTSKDGKPIVTEKPIGYFGGLEGALRQAVRMVTLDTLNGCEVSFQEFLDAYHKAESEVEEMLKRHTPQRLRRE